MFFELLRTFVVQNVRSRDTEIDRRFYSIRESQKTSKNVNQTIPRNKTTLLWSEKIH